MGPVQKDTNIQKGITYETQHEDASVNSNKHHLTWDSPTSSEIPKHIETSAGNIHGDLEDVAENSQSSMSEPPDHSETSSDNADAVSTWEGDDSNEINNQLDQHPRRGTRTRYKYDPNHMPSGTIEMARLTQRIEEDSSDSDDEVSCTSAGDP